MKIPPLSIDVINLNMDVLRPPSKGGDRYWDQEKGNKYHAVRTEIDGKKFDSKAEAGRYRELRMLQALGDISGLRDHVSYELRPAFTTRYGKKRKAMVYVADFVYTENGVTVIEDVKSPITRKNAVYRIKWALMEYRYKDDPSVVLYEYVTK